ncbi:rifin [Plasmodium sp. gorilla clade G1]|nr:rifin [Plasmodium sp. gorilla clade G1]
MKVHYINILLFVLPLNILVHNQRNHKKTIFRTPKTKPTKTHRTLCECELYAPSNYENDKEMKEVMDNFNRQTYERFREYDEEFQNKRKQCKEQCEKYIQKIILKDKIEKELTEKFSTLETNITTKDIPTCVCEKSVADKVEKTCLKCAGVLGGGIAPSWGLISGIVYTGWKTAALAAAKEFAAKAGAADGAAAGTQEGIKSVISGLEALGIDKLDIGPFKSFFTTKHYIDIPRISKVINMQYDNKCGALSSSGNTMCSDIGPKLNLLANTGEAPVAPEVAIGKKVTEVVTEATRVAEATTLDVTTKQTAVIEAAKKSAIETTYMGYQTAIIASVVAIIIIVLVMVIIYLILRYRRKHKMKKKLQYIKLLKE